MEKDWWEEMEVPYTAKKSIKSLVKRKREMEQAKQMMLFSLGLTTVLVVIFCVLALGLNRPAIGEGFSVYISHFYDYKELLFFTAALYVTSRVTVHHYKNKKEKFKGLRGEVMENFLENDESLTETAHSKRYDNLAKRMEKDHKIKMYHIK